MFCKRDLTIDMFDPVFWTEKISQQLGLCNLRELYLVLGPILLRPRPVSPFC